MTRAGRKDLRPGGCAARGRKGGDGSIVSGGRIAVLTGAALVAVSPAAARAQAQEAPRDGFELGGQVQVIYDSNLLRLRDDLPAPPGRSRDDLVTSPSAVLHAQTSPGLQRFALDAQVGRDYHLNNTFLDSSRIAATGVWDGHITPRCDTGATARFARAQVDLSEQGLIAANRRQVFTVLANARCRVTLGLAPLVSYERRESANSALVRRSTDFRTSAVSVGVAYNRTGKTGVSLRYLHARFNYPNRPDLLSGGGDRVGHDAVEAHGEATLAERINLGLTGRYDWAGADSGRDRFHGFTGEVTASVRPIPRFDVSAVAAREIDPAVFVAADYTVFDRASLGAGYAVSPRTRFDLAGGVERNRYRGRQLIGLADIRSFDRLLYVSGSVTYRLLRRADLVLELRHDDRITDSAFGTFAGTRALASFKLTI